MSWGLDNQEVNVKECTPQYRQFHASIHYMHPKVVFPLAFRECEEYKRWKTISAAEASGDTAAAEGALAELKLRDKDGNEIEKRLPGGKVCPALPYLGAVRQGVAVYPCAGQGVSVDHETCRF